MCDPIATELPSVSRERPARLPPASVVGMEAGIRHGGRQPLPALSVDRGKGPPRVRPVRQRQLAQRIDIGGDSAGVGPRNARAHCDRSGAALAHRAGSVPARSRGTERLTPTSLRSASSQPARTPASSWSPIAKPSSWRPGRLRQPRGSRENRGLVDSDHRAVAEHPAPADHLVGRRWWSSRIQCGEGGSQGREHERCRGRAAPDRRAVQPRGVQSGGVARGPCAAGGGHPPCFAGTGPALVVDVPELVERPATLSTANMSLPSLEDMPSVPSARLTSFEEHRHGADPAAELHIGDRVMDDVVPESRSSSMSPAVSQIPCSKLTRGPRKPSARRCSGRVRPYILWPETPAFASRTHGCGSGGRARRRARPRPPESRPCTVAVRTARARSRSPRRDGGGGSPRRGRTPRIRPRSAADHRRSVRSGRIDQSLVEHDGLVEGTVAHAKHDQARRPRSR